MNARRSSLRSGPCGTTRRGRRRAFFRDVVAAGVVAAVLVVGSAAHGEVLGWIEADLGGKEMSWHTITVARTDGDIATASLRLGPRLTEFQIQGHRTAAFTSRDVLSLDLRYPVPFELGAPPVAIDILYMPEGMGGPFWTSAGAGMAPVVQLLSLDVWGSYGRVEALFAGELCLRPIISSATDPDTCRDLTGRIETELLVDRGAVRSGQGVAGPDSGAGQSK